MKFRTACMICAGWLAIVASAPADVVWSGEQNPSVDYILGHPIDFNSDSLTDVALYYDFSGDTSVEMGRISAYVDGIRVDGSNRILADSSNWHNAALPFGTLISASPDPYIDPALEWLGGTYFSGTVSSWTVYNPNNPQHPPSESDEEWRGLLGENGNTYIGIEFAVEGATHYGWINIALGTDSFHYDFRDPITVSWAYESTPNTPIAAGVIPEPSTGILTMVGSLSLLFLARSRRRGKQGLLGSRRY